MSDRDELAATVRPVLASYGATGTVPPENPLGIPQWTDRLSAEESDCPESIADAVIAAGWRKKPSRGDLIVQLAQFWAGQHSLETATDAILALLDGPTETGGE